MFLLLKILPELTEMFKNVQTCSILLVITQDTYEMKRLHNQFWTLSSPFIPLQRYIRPRKVPQPAVGELCHHRSCPSLSSGGCMCGVGKGSVWIQGLL